MQLPINIKNLLSSGKVEWERLEFKEGWNPEAVLHSLCAFANDFHNLGGGYIVIGVAEKDGRPVLPPKGVKANQIDKIQREIIELGHKIQPFFHPVIAPCVMGDKAILVLWASGGQTRPYKAPVSLSKKNREYAYYIRKGPVTVRAQHKDEVELIGLAATVPFDDRINQNASIDDLDLGLIRAYLQQVGSDLFSEAHKMDFIELCRRMNIIDGPDEFIRPRNVGLMFFNDHPYHFFPQTQIDVVHFPDGPGADSFTEKIFKGPINIMLAAALNHIQSQFIEENIQKFPDRLKAERRFNYPYVAIKEILTNAVYHRSYEIREPVEVRILPDRITIGSFPGPDRSIADKDIQQYRLVSRRYRNRRIGEFLKELDMTEGRGTGLPKILRAIKNNDSPQPIFYTDEDRSYFVAELPIHPKFIELKEAIGDILQVTPEVTLEVTPEVQRLLCTLNGDMDRQSLQKKLKLKAEKNFRLLYLRPAIDMGLIKMTIPEKPNSRLQKYRLTEKGKNIRI